MATIYGCKLKMQPNLVAVVNNNAYICTKFQIMKIGAILTGDIVDSTKMHVEERNSMLRMLQSLPELLSPVTAIDLEIFRGDSFQIRVVNTIDSLKVALAIRAHIRSFKFAEYKRQWDARISIGIGTVDYENGTLAMSDGEAYRASGRGLDAIGKCRLIVETPWEEVNKELRVSTAFADDIVSGWTQSQSRVMFQSLITDISHAEIGCLLGITRQMVDKALRAGKEELMTLYINRYEELIKNRL